MDNEFRIALTPVQLAAVLSDKSITEGETLSNRLWGGLDFMIGVSEMAGATALCVAPDPSMMTKVGCVVIGTHSMDAVNTAIKKIMTGKNARTATSQIAEQLAKRLGADEQSAVNIGVAVDIAIPMSFAGAIGAARVTSIRLGRIELAAHESMTGYKPGGHTLSKHVSIPKADLLKRLNSNTRISGVSSFFNVKIAELAISDAMHANARRITLWASSSPSTKLVLEHVYSKTVGHYIKKGSADLITTSRFKIVLEYQKFNGKSYYILTAYPTW